MAKEEKTKDEKPKEKNTFEREFNLWFGNKKDKIRGSIGRWSNRPDQQCVSVCIEGKWYNGLVFKHEPKKKEE